MSQSNLVTRQWWANSTNYTAGRTDTIHGIVIHHSASTTIESVGNVFSQPNRGASAHYGVKGSQIHQYVREEDTAWHCGNWAGNCCTIGIEVVNSTGAPNWLVDEETFNTTVKLVAEIAKRNGLGKIKFDPDGVYPTLSAHRDWSATYCPGDYLYSRMNEIAEKANAINYPAPAPEPKVELVWTKLDAVVDYECASQPTNLLNFNKSDLNSLATVKTYDKGFIIPVYGKVLNKAINKTFLLTEYSFTKKITNGFLDSTMKLHKPAEEPKKEEPVEQPKDEKKDVVEPPMSPEEQPERGLNEEEYQQICANLKSVENNAKEKKVMLPMSSKVYDVLKIVAIVVLPLLQALYTGLSSIWGFGFGEQIDQTIQLIIALINTLLGLALVKSSSDYHKGDA